MTDKDIIKALECASYYDCDKCPHHQENCDDRIADQYELSKDALDLINRQQAEIERLQKAYKQCAWERDVFVGDFEELVAKEISILKMDINTIKAEAIKEFAERLKALDRLDVDVSYGYGREHYTEAIAVNLIDNLVKEMVGEE